MKRLAADSREVLITPTAGTATVAGVLDCIDADYAVIEVAMTKSVNTNAAAVVVTLSESDDTVVTNFATFAAQDAVSVAVNTTDARLATLKVPLSGNRKRYLRLLSTPGTHTTNDVVTVTAIGVLDKDSR